MISPLKTKTCGKKKIFWYYIVPNWRPITRPYPIFYGLVYYFLGYGAVYHEQYPSVKCATPTWVVENKGQSDDGGRCHHWPLNFFFLWMVFPTTIHRIFFFKSQWWQRPCCPIGLCFPPLMSGWHISLKDTVLYFRTNTVLYRI